MMYSGFQIESHSVHHPKLSGLVVLYIYFAHSSPLSVRLGISTVAMARVLSHIKYLTLRISTSF